MRECPGRLLALEQQNRPAAPARRSDTQYAADRPRRRSTSLSGPHSGRQGCIPGALPLETYRRRPGLSSLGESWRRVADGRRTKTGRPGSPARTNGDAPQVNNLDRNIKSASQLMESWTSQNHFDADGSTHAAPIRLVLHPRRPPTSWTPSAAPRLMPSGGALTRCGQAQRWPKIARPRLPTATADPHSSEGCAHRAGMSHRAALFRPGRTAGKRECWRVETRTPRRHPRVENIAKLACRKSPTRKDRSARRASGDC